MRAQLRMEKGVGLDWFGLIWFGLVWLIPDKTFIRNTEAHNDTEYIFSHEFVRLKGNKTFRAHKMSLPECHTSHPKASSGRSSRLHFQVVQNSGTHLRPLRSDKEIILLF